MIDDDVTAPGCAKRRRRRTNEHRGGHRLVFPSLGSIPVTHSSYILRRWIDKGGRPTSARFINDGTKRWVAITVAFAGDNPYVLPPMPTRL